MMTGSRRRSPAAVAALALAATLTAALTLTLTPARAAGAAPATSGSDGMDGEAHRRELLETDRAFSELSRREGRRVAFERYMAPDATIYREGADPFSGREAILGLFPPDAAGELTWEPTRAEVAASGDLGYTLGTYEFTAAGADGEPQVSRGYYVTIWRRQPDGRWRWVFDSGVQAPAHEP